MRTDPRVSKSKLRLNVENCRLLNMKIRFAFINFFPRNFVIVGKIDASKLRLNLAKETPPEVFLSLVFVEKCRKLRNVLNFSPVLFILSS